MIVARDLAPVPLPRHLVIMAAILQVATLAEAIGAVTTVVMVVSMASAVGALLFPL